MFRQFWRVDCRWPRKPAALHANDLAIKKVLAYCIDIIYSDYNRIRKRDQLVRKWTLKYLAKVSLNGLVFAFKVIRHWIKSYCIYSNFRYSILVYPTNIKFSRRSIVWIIGYLKENWRIIGRIIELPIIFTTTKK